MTTVRSSSQTVVLGSLVWWSTMLGAILTAGQVARWAALRGVLLGATALVARRVLLRCEVQPTTEERRRAERFERESDDEEVERLVEGLDVATPEDGVVALAAKVACGREDGRGRVRSAFLRRWVNELRLEFPARQNRPSDRAAMAKWLTGRLREHGVRVAHMADMVPRAVALAINKGRSEVLAEAEADAARVRSVAGRLWQKLTGTDAAPPSMVGC